MISQKSIDEVLNVSRIDDIVKDYVDLKSRGANLIGLCPFHKEKTPSFYVSAQKNIFKCFGCGKGGTPVQFIMEAEHMNFPEAVRQLAKKYQIELEESKSSEQSLEEQLESESLHIVNQFALDYYKNILWNHPTGQSIGLSYLKERGFLESTIEKFEIGYALQGPDEFYREAISKGFKDEFLQRLGLVNSNHKDFFRERIIFPIHNTTGKPIAFAGRILQSNPKTAKYINSPETELYNKSKTLYGLHLARKSIRDKKFCILVEGYTDVMALSQAGIENVVASSGTSLTEEQILSIKRLCSTICILYDGDPAGIKAASRGIDLILQENINVRIALIPGNEDPDSYIKKVGSEAFETFLQNDAVDFILFKLNTQLDTYKSDPIEKANIASEIIRSISKVPDPIRRSIYIKEASQKLNIDELSLIESCNTLLRDAIRQRSFQEQRKALDRDQQIFKELDEKNTLPRAPQKHQISNDEFQEKDLCRVLMLYGNEWFNEEQGIPFSSYIIDNISDTIPFFENPLIKKIVLDVSKSITEGQIHDINYFISHQDKEIADLALEFTLSKYDYSKNWSDRLGIFLSTQKEPELNFFADITNTLLRFKLRKYNKAIQEFEQRFKELSETEDSLEIDLKSHQHIINERNYIASLLNMVVIH